MAGLLLLGFALLLFVAVATHSTQDFPYRDFGAAPDNAAGRFGEYMSALLGPLFMGQWPAVVFPFIIGLWGWTLVRRHSRRSAVIVSVWTLALGLWSSTSIGVIGDLVHRDNISSYYAQSGEFGFWSAHQLILLAGRFGAVLAMLVLMLVGLTMTMAGFAEWIERRAAQTAQIAGKAKSLPLPSVVPAWRFLKNWMASKKEPEETIPTVDIDRVRETPSQHETAEPLPRVAAADGHAGKVLHNLGEEIDPLTGARRATVRASEQMTMSVDDHSGYVFPAADCFNLPPADRIGGMSRDEQQHNAELLEKSLDTFGVKAQVTQVNPGPVITQFELAPAPGVKVARIESLADDLALALRARGLRILAPIPGKAAVGVEMANPKPALVTFREVVESQQFQTAKSKLTIALGRTVNGEILTADLGSLPHLLIAGTTGSGKSVCVNAIITSILLRATPEEVQFVMIDPKKLELAAYNELRNHHLTHRPDLSEHVITKPDEAVKVLRSCLVEMERRYDMLAERGARQLSEYNVMVKEDPREGDRPLPYIVVLIDELADLMVTAQREVEEPIARLAQLARAVGIHMVVATQRPSVDVITGVIKANFPARIAFRVAMKVDSRTILDTNGAEMLLGQGDMLFQHPEEPAPQRVQGALLTSSEIARVITHIRKQPPPRAKLVLPLDQQEEREGAVVDGQLEGRDPLFLEAAKIVVRTGQGSVSILQRRLKVGYSRAARLIDQLERAGVVGPFDGSKARAVLADEQTLMDLEQQ
ncbi:MAG: DNA translocase FtsK 4TM domain-containing protein [Calditrichaeota bacterium]|nr:DNA translocase FtsK 4TM domain-containing protein [Calditrichota bacterium]